MLHVLKYSVKRQKKNLLLYENIVQ